MYDFVWIHHQWNLCEIRIYVRKENKETAVLCSDFCFSTVSPQISLKHTHSHPRMGTADDDIHFQLKTLHGKNQKSRLDGKPADLVSCLNCLVIKSNAHTQKSSPYTLMPCKAIFSVLSWIPFPSFNKEESYSKKSLWKRKRGKIQKPNKAKFTIVHIVFGQSVTSFPLYWFISAEIWPCANKKWNIWLLANRQKRRQYK